MDNIKPRVLLADDEVHIRMMMKAVINSMSYEIIAEAATGQEAVSLFKLNKPDIVLMDINMPLKTGPEALKEIMEIDPDACVIMLTSVSDMESVEECIKAGAMNYIRKDTPLMVIKAMIAETWESCKSGKNH